MQVHQCSSGQRVIHKESGKTATIRRIYPSSGELELEFENGTTSKVHVRLVSPADQPDGEATEGGPSRPCPQCAAKMPVDAKVCPACGFQYGVRQPKPSLGPVKLLLLVAVLVAIAYGVWKYLLAGRS